MSAIFKLPSDLHGKQIVPILATLDVELTLVPWKNHCQWMHDLDQQLWIENIEKTNITVEIIMGSNVLFCQTMTGTGAMKIHIEFDDSQPGNCDLHIKITNLNHLPAIHYSEQGDIRGMLQINSVRLQSIELSNFIRCNVFDRIDDLRFGGDVDICVPMSSPIYAWMVKNHSAILPGIFKLPIVDI